MIFVAKNEENQEVAQLQKLNAELTDSLKRCRQIVADCQSKLASNSNTPEEENEAVARSR
jgi:hypothetical protein